MTGHGFCIDCKSSIFQGSARPNCPNCRLRIRDRDAHPLFLELVDSKVAFVSSLVESLEEMDHETPLLSIKKAGQKLTKVLQDPQPLEDSNAMVKKTGSLGSFFNLIPLIIFWIFLLPKDCTCQGYKRFQRTYRSSLYQSTSSNTPNHRLDRGLSGEP